MLYSNIEKLLQLKEAEKRLLNSGKFEIWIRKTIGAAYLY